MAGRQQRLITHLEAQGAQIKRTKKGFIVYAPNGESVAFHNTPSDYRTLANEKAQLRRIGLTHVDEKKRTKGPAVRDEDGYPAYITEGGVTKRTREKALSILAGQGWPLQVTTGDLSEMGHVVTIAKALYSIGFRYPESEPKRKKDGSTIWVAPEDLRKLHEQSYPNRNEDMCKHEAWETSFDGRSRTCADCKENLPPLPEEIRPPVTIQDMAKAVANVFPHREDPEVEEEEGREFIDTVDSWVVENPPPAVQDYLDMLNGAGLEVEIRVWRDNKKEKKDES